jgi:hypothetical protein
MGPGMPFTITLSAICSALLLLALLLLASLVLLLLLLPTPLRPGRWKPTTRYTDKASATNPNRTIMALLLGTQKSEQDANYTLIYPNTR